MSDLPLLAALLLLLTGIAVLDARSGIIPNPANLLLGALGALAALLDGPDVLTSRLIDAALVGALLLTLRRLYRRGRGRTGLGLGDVKFLAAATLSLGLADLFAALFLASLAALAFLGVRALRGARIAPDTRLRFGPFLAGAVGAAAVLRHLQGI